MTRLNPNEDLQDQVERGRRERDGKRLLPIAIKAGWVSLLASSFAIVLWLIFFAIMWKGPDHWFLMELAFLPFLAGQGATLMTYGLLLRMKLDGTDVSIRKPLLLGIPGALVSALISALILALSLA